MSIENNKLMNLADGKVLYDDLRGRIEDIDDQIIISATEPTESRAELWIDNGATNEHQVPTYAEFQGLTSALNVLEPSASAGDVGKVPKVKTVADGKVSEYEFGSLPSVPVQDVQANGTSVVSNGIANIPYATSGQFGVTKAKNAFGTNVDSVDHTITIFKADDSQVKAGTHIYRPIVPSNEHMATFYGLAKAAGADMKNLSDETVGVYPEAQKSAISQMLDAPETVSGTTPSITGNSGIRYVCGEVATLSITPPQTGCIDVVFTSGSTPTVLTVPNTVKFPSWFDATSLDANCTYEINILDGVYGVVTSWA